MGARQHFALWLAALSATGLFLSPVAAKGTVEAKRAAILQYLQQLPSQKKTLTGVQVNEYEVYLDCTAADRLFEQTGKRPAIVGLELMNAIAYPPYPSYLVDRAVTQTLNGGLVTMSWHERNPVEVCQRGEFYECAKKAMDAQTLHAVLTPGTPEHKLWLNDVQAMAKTLRDLKNRGVVVLFRPYHEMNGGWFWWGKQAELPQLWDALYDELAVHQKLDNLIWVWSPDRDAPDAKSYFPVRHKPDIVGTDMYENDANTPKYATARANITAAGGSAPFAFTEVGLAPGRQVLEQVNPVWVLLWGDMINMNWTWNGDCAWCNKPEQIDAFFKIERLVNRGDLPAGLRKTISAGVSNPQPLHKPNPYCPAKIR